MQARVVVLNEVCKGKKGDWNLCFQYCRYEYGDNTEELGYRFIWRRPNGNLQGARGQARIPSVADALSLIAMAIDAGWGHHLEAKTGHDYPDGDEE
jgi:hypothetical protein